ncbi:MAG TPA: hypothetical protein DF774_00045 [Rheinheimera sp.]|uniref:hypothetical protein n=1 Tax=Rheinheimera sp. TaxID=1869214 RepID=UPI000ECE20C6|nr:hypothetical protein [Rheinheimera sp.]HCU64127.1 hypothetical protein [Rheinheimera sp.]
MDKPDITPFFYLHRNQLLAGLSFKPFCQLSSCGLINIDALFLIQKQCTKVPNTGNYNAHRFVPSALTQQLLVFVVLIDGG